MLPDQSWYCVGWQVLQVSGSTSSSCVSWLGAEPPQPGGVMAAQATATPSAVTACMSPTILRREGTFIGSFGPHSTPGPRQLLGAPQTSQSSRVCRATVAAASPPSPSPLVSCAGAFEGGIMQF